MPQKVGNSTIVPHLTLCGPHQTHAAPSGEKWLKKTQFPISLTLTFDLEIQKVSECGSRPMSMPKFKVIAPTAQAAGGVTDRQTN